MLTGRCRWPCYADISSAVKLPLGAVIIGGKLRTWQPLSTGFFRVRLSGAQALWLLLLCALIPVVEPLVFYLRV